ncbi:DUF4373 domain-containing protein [Enterococcus hirae]|uniref:Lin1244/Lin1753 domain-containing protein n=5 Tax=Enterococcus TaxID=1350 RepID=UPI0004D4B25E|nr:Lin1244/Lin1753 domain-containing protein [Enterococcus hirae]KDR93599.1 hypothetical protein EI18_07200 [Enterococcus hirae]MDT2632460.1 DUF4373 domain-containing protein [Enterococcus hirae]STD80725.1 DnaD domain-containing protein [Enterococcus hirae]
MARPYKQGVDYYSLDVDFLKDIKYRKIRRSCGSQTCEILLCLLGYIYGDMGYFLRWDEDSAFLVADDVGAKEGLVEEVVSKAIQVGFFNREKYEKYQILTSNGIQKRYKLITRKRKEVSIKKEYLVNDDNNLVNGGNNSTSTVVNGVRNTQIEREIEKESKVNETRVSSSRSSIDIHSENIAESYWLNQVNPAEAPMVLESIRFWVNDFQGQDEIVIMAIEEMLKNGAKNYNYLDRVLKNWENKQLDTVEKVRKYLQGHYSKSPRNANKTLEYEKFSTDELPI